MLGLPSTQNNERIAKLDALDKSQAIIEFNMDGLILTANENFLKTLGYSLDEIKGKHHSMFVDPAYRTGEEYRRFWESLKRGEFQAAQYKRFGKGGREIWIEASYNPVLDNRGKPFKVVKFATDITDRKRRDADFEGQVSAIGKSQAVIEFNLDGTIITANPNFLGTMGYSLDEIQGKHHSIFVDPNYKNTMEYRQFWEALNRGEFQAAQYKRLAKGGREIWIEASYNPIFDPSGRPFKVVKYATDITKQVELMESLRNLLDKNFKEIDEAIFESTSQCTVASASATETSSNVQSVASGSEELEASIQEISRNMSQSTAAVTQAFEQTLAAEQSTSMLAEAAKSMTSIVGLIQNIASQINLLSLNATIEAARAGEAGKGFAVVAQEVKSLALQAADATEQITKEIEGMQNISGEVVTALHTIKEGVSAVREYVTTCASAVEEQSAVVRDMSSNMQSASAAVNGINESISEISVAVKLAENTVASTKEAAQVLARSG